MHASTAAQSLRGSRPRRSRGGMGLPLRIFPPCRESIAARRRSLSTRQPPVRRNLPSQSRLPELLQARGTGRCSGRREHRGFQADADPAPTARRANALRRRSRAPLEPGGRTGSRRLRQPPTRHPPAPVDPSTHIHRPIHRSLMDVLTAQYVLADGTICAHTVPLRYRWTELAIGRRNVLIAELVHPNLRSIHNYQRCSYPEIPDGSIGVSPGRGTRGRTLPTLGSRDRFFIPLPPFAGRLL